jgi:hypothetical protein
MVKTGFFFASITVIDQAERSCTCGWHIATLSSRTCGVGPRHGHAAEFNPRAIGELALPIREMEVITRHAASPWTQRRLIFPHLANANDRPVTSYL